MDKVTVDYNGMYQEFVVVMKNDVVGDGYSFIVRHDLHEDMDVPFGVGPEMLFWKGKMVTVTEVHPDSEAIYVEGNNWVWSLSTLEEHIPQTPPQIMQLDF